MSRVLFAVLSFVAAVATGSARAADFGPLPVEYEEVTLPWTGCYVGPEVGAIFSGGSSGAGGGLSATVGGLVGCNYHAGRAVFGAEAEAMWSGLSANNDSTTSMATTQNHWDGDIAARIGYLVRYNILSYFKVGAAFGDYKFTTTTTTFPFPTTVTSGGLTMAGLLVGGGVEFMLTPRWFARGEADFVLFSPKDATLTCTPAVFCTSGATLSTQIEAQFHIRVGVTYRFM